MLGPITKMSEIRTFVRFKCKTYVVNTIRFGDVILYLLRNSNYFLESINTLLFVAEGSAFYGVGSQILNLTWLIAVLQMVTE